jgi:hypothetical protein
MARPAIGFFCILVAACCFRSNAEWKMISGEFSIISQIKGKFNRDNIRTVFSFDTDHGTIRMLKSSISEGRLIEQWNTLHESCDDCGGIEMVFAEHTMISSISRDDIDGESLYGVFYIEKKTGKAFRLMPIKNAMHWQQLPVPRPIENADWSLFSSEHTIAVFDIRRQNTYSVFLIEKNTGTTFMVETRYISDKGLIVDSLIPIDSPPTPPPSIPLPLDMKKKESQ